MQGVNRKTDGSYQKPIHNFKDHTRQPKASAGILIRETEKLKTGGPCHLSPVTKVVVEAIGIEPPASGRRLFEVGSIHPITT